MPTDPIDGLKHAVEAAAAREQKALKEHGSVPILPRSEWLADGDWSLVWKIVRLLRRDYVKVAIRFPEDVLAVAVVDLVADADAAPTLAALAKSLEAFAISEGPWLISTPLANIRLTDPVIEVGQQAVLWHAISGPAWLKDRDAASGDLSAAQVHKILGDRVSQVTEWTEYDGVPLDTRRGASLLTVEEGVAGLALPRARSRAQYAIAVWSILSPPAESELVPDLGVWIPQPYIHALQRYKRREHDAWIAKESVRGGGSIHWEPYTVPSSDILKVPFEAFSHLDRRCAQALLSASLALFNATRRSRSELSGQLRNTMAALEVLCEEQGTAFAAEARWAKVAARLDVWNKLSHLGYDAPELKELQKRLKHARNIATHGADAALLDLGYPAHAQRQVSKTMIRPGTDFAYATLAADLAPLRFALAFVIRKLFELVRAAGWDDKTFEAQFV